MFGKVLEYFCTKCACYPFTFGQKRNISAALSSGFLCWQVRTDRQNDAVMFGASLSYGYSDIFKLKAEYGGYFGWRQDGDGPNRLNIRADFLQDRRVSPYISYQHGFRDWPYDYLLIGVNVYFDIFHQGNLRSRH